MLHSKRSNGLLESASNAHSVVAVTALRLATSLIGSAKWFLDGLRQPTRPQFVAQPSVL